VHHVFVITANINRLPSPAGQPYWCATRVVCWQHCARVGLVAGLGSNQSTIWYAWAAFPALQTIIVRQSQCAQLVHASNVPTSTPYCSPTTRVQRILCLRTCCC